MGREVGDDDLYEELMRLPQLLVVEGARAAGALAAQLGLTSGAATFVVDRLERAGHLCRARDVVYRRRQS